jgi:hypothetical protein
MKNNLDNILLIEVFTLNVDYQNHNGKYNQ